MSGLFAVFCTSSFIFETFHITNVISSITYLLTGLSGVAAIWSMASVYRLKTTPLWNTSKTYIEFFASSILMGLTTIITISSIWREVEFPSQTLITTTLFLIVLLFLALIINGNPFDVPGILKKKIRFGLIVFGVIFLIMTQYFSESSPWLFLSIFSLIISGEFVGRLLFYERRNLIF